MRLQRVIDQRSRMGSGSALPSFMPPKNMRGARVRLAVRFGFRGPKPLSLQNLAVSRHAGTLWRLPAFAGIGQKIRDEALAEAIRQERRVPLVPDENRRHIRVTGLHFLYSRSR